jgi:hypothetical protein
MHDDTEMHAVPEECMPGSVDEIDDELEEDDLDWVLGFPEPALHPTDLLRKAGVVGPDPAALFGRHAVPGGWKHHALPSASVRARRRPA